MVGKTPAHIVASRPLVDGVISDFEVTEEMLTYFINKARDGKFSHLAKPRVLVGIPSGVTDVEKKAVQEATLNGGAGEAYLIEEPIAAAIGARLPIQEAGGNMIVDIGGGTSEIAVISLGGAVVAESLRVGGDKMNENIISYVRENFNLLLGEKTAEDVKIAIGSAYRLDKPIKLAIRGRDLITGLPKELEITDADIRQAIQKSVKAIVNSIKNVLEKTPPELLGDIMRKGIIMAGGGSLVRGFDKLISEQTQMPVKVMEDPLTAVVRGTGIVLEDIDELKSLMIDTYADDNKPKW
jgi:rod shape-determining protein MreB